MKINALLLSLFAFFSGCYFQPEPTAQTSGELLGCPPTPNCISASKNNPSILMNPWPYRGTSRQAMAHLRLGLDGSGDYQVHHQTSTYLQLSYRSRVFRFVDDVEFYVDAKSRKIYFRSASRLGIFDFGANYLRLRSIRSSFLERQKDI